MNRPATVYRRIGPIWTQKRGERPLALTPDEPPNPTNPRTLRTHEPLENELQPELQDPRIALIRVRAGDASKRRAVQSGRRIGEIHLVEDVEELRPELHAHVVTEANVLAQSHIKVEGLRSEVGAS